MTSTLQKYEPPQITPSRGGRTPVGTTDGFPGFQPTHIGGFYPTAPYAALRTFIDGEGNVAEYPVGYFNYRLNYELLTQSPPISDEEITQLIENNLRGHFDPSRPYVYLFADYNAWLPGPDPAVVAPTPEIYLQYLPQSWGSGGVTSDSFPERGRFTFTVDMGAYGVVGLAGPGVDLGDPSAVPFGFLFRSVDTVQIIESGVEHAPSVTTYISPTTQFAVQYVDGVVTYYADATVLRTVTVTPEALPVVFRGTAVLYGANSRVSGISVVGYAKAAARLPALIKIGGGAEVSLPGLSTSAGWLPYAALSLSAMRTVGGNTPYAYAAAVLRPFTLASGWRGAGATSLRPLTMTGGQRSAGAVTLRLAVRGGDYAQADASLRLPGMAVRGYAGRESPKGGMYVLPRMRGVGTGGTSSGGGSATRLPALTMRSAPYSSAAMTLRRLEGFGFQDPAGEAFISGAPIGRREFTGTPLVLVQLDSAGSIVSVAAMTVVLDDQMPGAAQIIDSATTTAILTALMDSALVGASFQPMSEQGAETWVVNAETGASSSYSSYAFNSFGTVNGQLYGARSDGLYLMEGDTDDALPIRAYLAFGATNFNTEKLKRMEYATLGVSSSGTMFLKVKIRGGEEYTYSARRSDDYMAVQRIDVGRGIRASYLEFELYNSDGCDFELNTVSFHAAELARRI